MTKELQRAIKVAVKDLFDVDVEPDLTRPEEQFGDYSTNVAMQLAPKVGKTPREIAETLVPKIQNNQSVEKIEVASPGFLNIYLTSQAILDSLSSEPAKKWAGKSVVVEFSDPNPFKELHVGHLYDGIVGDAIANLYQALGGEVHRVNFGGDVGLHVARAMWGIIKKLGGENPEKLVDVPSDQRAQWLSQAYVDGAKAYDEDESAKAEIIELNQCIYKIHEEDDRQSPPAKIYWTCRQWSYDYFEDFYARIGTKFEKYYPESTTAPVGLKAVKEQLAKGVFEESNGAVVFNGEVHSLHTRVFINSKGLPTYETKDIGLALCKWQDYHFDQNTILTGNEIVEYMKVVLAALEKFEPQIAKRTTHLPHGMVKMAGGSKMSSRKGNVIRALDVLDMTSETVRSTSGKDSEEVMLAAVKYAFLKSRIGADIIFDTAESVSLQGNSGPYLQYAYVRARSILNKAGSQNLEPRTYNLEPSERSLARKLSEYPQVVEDATDELLPSHITTYLYELAQTFNRFYEKNRVIGDDRQDLRLNLVKNYAETLKKGLQLLNIPVVEQM